MEEEDQAISWDDRILKIHSVIKETGDISDTTKLKYPLPENYLLERKKIVQIFLSVIMACIFTSLFGYILFAKYSTGVLLVSVILLPLLYYVLFKNLTRKDLNFKIIFSKKGIAIMDKYYDWNEIQETFFVYRPNGRYRNIYFIIGLKNGFLDRYHMNNLLEFNINEGTISALIKAYSS